MVTVLPQYLHVIVSVAGDAAPLALTRSKWFMTASSARSFTGYVNFGVSVLIRGDRRRGGKCDFCSFPEAPASLAADVEDFLAFLALARFGLFGV